MTHWVQDSSRFTKSTISGLIDSGFSSLATFAVGVAAFQLLSSEELGVYALLFSGFVWTALLPLNAYLLPLEIRLVSLPSNLRLAAFRFSIARGLTLGIAAAVMLLVVTAAVSRVAGPSKEMAGVYGLALTTAGVTVVSPVQDHFRRLFHLAKRSELASLTSLIQLLGVSLALGTLTQLGVDRSWIPMGSLFIANVISLGLASVVGARAAKGSSTPVPPDRGEMRGLGGWLLFQGAVQQGAHLGAASLLAIIGGLVALGQVEGAKVVAQPLLVLSVGLNASFGPRSMEAAEGGNSERARLLRSKYLRWLLPIGIGYLAYVQLGSPLNVMRYLVPAGFATAGLVTIQLLGSLINGASSPHRNELLALRGERSLSLIELVAAGLLLLVTATSSAHIGPYSLPAGVVLAAIVRFGWRKRLADIAVKRRFGNERGVGVPGS